MKFKLPPSTSVLALTVLAGLLPAPAARSQERVEFDGVFAPSDSYVAAPETPLRQDLCLNGRWQFQPVEVPASFVPGSGQPPALPAPDPQKWSQTPIKIPSPWNVNTWGNGGDCGNGSRAPLVADSVYYPSYPLEWNAARMAWLRRTFTVPATWNGRRVVVHFEAVAGEAQVFVNGKPAGAHFDSFLPFEMDISGLINRTGDNELLVGVRKSSLFNIVTPGYPKGQQRTYPNGSNMDDLVGIWNDVFLLGLPPVRVGDTFVQTDLARDTLLVQVTLRNDSAQPQTVTVGGSVSPWVNLAGKEVLAAPVPAWRLDQAVLNLAPRQAAVPAGGQVDLVLQAPAGGTLKPWSPDAPNLHGLVLDVAGDSDGRIIDRKYTRFGWRQFEIRGRGLFLNGKPLQLWGDFGHPFGPFIGSRRYVWADYRMIKDFGGNTVRPHANVMPRLWAELADEMGLCVLSESAVFGSSINLNLKEPITWERCERHVDDMVRRDRNHPSIVGWSPGNEMFALSLHTSPQDKEAVAPKLKALAERPRRLDPTRQWISMDGDKDLDGILPVWSSHFGIGIPDNLPDLDKPRIIGEHGGTYFAGPPRLEMFNGDRAYESYAGRNEALAIDLYRMVTQCAKPQLTAFSPSELVWFGLEHLPFGYRTASRPPDQRTDGIWFPKYVEGTPGVQIERLPSYVMTLNPGFDPALPLYKPMAMFEALKAALDPRGPQPCPWDKLPATPARTQPAATNRITRVAFAGQPAGTLYGSLAEAGLPFAGSGGDPASGKGEAAGLLIIDGETLDAAQAAEARRASREVWARGGLVWVMLHSRAEALTLLGDLMPPGIRLTDRKASSLLRGVTDPAFDGFSLGRLYFAGQTSGDGPIQRAGLAGAPIEAGRVLLTAAKTDWTLFERAPERSKCSSMLIYEHLEKPPGAALVELAGQGGKLWISTLDAAMEVPAREVFWSQVFRNVGVKLAKPPVNWLIPTGKQSASEWRYKATAFEQGFTVPDFDDLAWSKGAGPFGAPPRAQARTPWSGPDICLRRNFTLEHLPRSLRLTIHHSGGLEIYLNGARVFSETKTTNDYETITLSAKETKAAKIGMNILTVRCRDAAANPFVDVGLAASSLSARDEAQHDLLLDGPPQ